MEIGRYRIVRPLGRGGTAEVFEAVAEGSGGFTRRVAIKRLLAEHAGEPALARMFIDEARIGSQLHHASIVAVLDFGVSNGAPFQVQQLVDGIDAVALFDLAASRGRPLPLPIVLFIGTEIAHALHYAHTASDAQGRSLGIVHRDVSPANILVSYGADVMLTDFGIAFAKDRSERTAAGTRKGTLSYCAPEQAMGGVVDARADLFALAATLHRLLCGTSPLAGDHALADLLAGAELPIDAAIPDDVAAILRRALSRDRTARWPDAAAMADALGAALATRITTDPRSMLRSFLGDVRPAARPPAGKLDALLGIDVELALVGEENGVRTFEERTVTRAPVAVARAGSTPRRWPWIAAAGVVVALGTFAALRVDRPAELAEVAFEGLRIPSMPPSATVPSAPLATPTPPLLAGPPEEITTPPPTDVGTSRPSKPAATTKPKPAAAPAPAPPAATGSGFVLIGGPKATKAEIRVDGRAIGLYAPRKLELAIGDHHIELVDENGDTIATRSAKVTPRNTSTSPLRWMVD